jgi:hypothetical protein|uniref:hypothetical protein n=1 Tax=Halomonas sp. Ant2 TaxID=1630300 RepID=UPI001566E186|nr:hypothetical protein [Halomonas sp. Ant2]|tara:strand:- start:242 stop:526 length:285 start_codon:yes stop_codon:yes gene_type:complete
MARPVIKHAVFHAYLTTGKEKPGLLGRALSSAAFLANTHEHPAHASVVPSSYPCPDFLPEHPCSIVTTVTVTKANGDNVSYGYLSFFHDINIRD